MRDLNRSRMIQRHIEVMKAFEGKKVQVGWFETDRYPPKDGSSVGKSIAEVARLLEFGGAIQHPGGTQIGADNRFVRTTSSTGHSHKVTQPHVIPIPPRPFMRLAARKFMSLRKSIQKGIIDRALAGQITADQALERIGLIMEGEVVKSIRDGNWTPNAPSTVRRKGFDKPLIETGLMWQSVSSRVS
jgi:hypothetical protein